MFPNSGAISEALWYSLSAGSSPTTLRTTSVLSIIASFSAYYFNCHSAVVALFSMSSAMDLGEVKIGNPALSSLGFTSALAAESK
jgi:hypothetical protein